MQSVQTSVETRLTIKHSVFITILKPIKDLKAAQAFIDTIKQTYPDKSHHCYAYILGDNQEIQKAEDDNEPSGTAGMPILEVLKKHNLTDVCCVVMREFGGIKLGAGGLIRAYAKGAASAIEKSQFTKKKTVLKLRITAHFDHIGVVEHHLKSFDIRARDYTDYVHFTVLLDEAELSALKAQLIAETKDQVKIEILKTLRMYA